MGGLSRFRVALLMAWRNLFSHKGKNIIVGLIMVFGTFLVVLGTSLLDAIQTGMTQSVTGSIAGHLQVYDKDARDELALFGGGFMGAPDIGSIPDFSKVKETLLAVDNVDAVIPMGMDMAEFYTPSELDRAIEALRKALERSDEPAVRTMETKIRAMVALMKTEFENRRRIMKDTTEVDKQLADIERVLGDAFWQEVRADPGRLVMFLDTKLAPLVDENEGFWLQYIGTDIPAFVEHFDRFEMISGELIPPGRRGLLINQHFYDFQLKNRVARMLDKLERELEDRNKRIAKDPLLQNLVERMARQYRRITFQLDPEQAAELEVELHQLLPDAKATNLDELVQEFLRVDDQTFAARKAFFEEEIAPRIQLYLFNVGDVITIRAFTRSGYIKSVNVKVYGTFSFRGLEESAMAGGHSLMDIMTFRDLYGMMTKEKRQELASIQAAVGVEDVDAANAEDELFGGEDASTTAVALDTDAAAGFDEFANVNLKMKKLNGLAVHDTRFDQEAIDHGVALNAAIILEDFSRLDETRARVQAAMDDAGLNLQTIDWQQATGIVGQLVVLVRVVLYVAIFIIFTVAIVIMNNTMVMATMERTMEIGTMRAIGGQKRFVLALLLLETVMLGVIAGVLGAGIGGALVSHLGEAGIPAPSDELIFLFSGPHLYPTVETGHIVGAGVVIVLVSLAATFYPALLALRIQPVVAMQARE